MRQRIARRETPQLLVHEACVGGSDHNNIAGDTKRTKPAVAILEIVGERRMTTLIDHQHRSRRCRGAVRYATTCTTCSINVHSCVYFMVMQHFQVFMPTAVRRRTTHKMVDARGFVIIFSIRGAHSHAQPNNTTGCQQNNSTSQKQYCHLLVRRRMVVV